MRCRFPYDCRHHLSQTWCIGELYADFLARIEDMLAEGDRVATRVSYPATHQGEFMDIAATGNQITWTGFSIERFVDGKIVEHHALMDFYVVMEQLGDGPAEGPPHASQPSRAS